MTTRTRRALLVALACAVVAAVVLWSWRRPTPSGRDPLDAIEPGNVVMLGDSITEEGRWRSLLDGVDVVNAGRSGFTTEQLVPIASDVAARRPSAVFVLTGTNDIRDGHDPAWTARHLERLLDELATRSPDTVVVVQTVLPRSDAPDRVLAVNEAVRAVAADRSLRVLDLHPSFDDGRGGLRADETRDGLHLSPLGYERWSDLLLPVLDELGLR